MHLKNHPPRNRPQKPALSLACAAMLACAVPAGAATDPPDEAPRVSLRGFGTLGAVHANARNADVVSGFFQPNGAGETRPWAHTVDSKLGLQADAKITEQLSAVVQVVSQGRYDNSYTPQVEWANLKYQFTPDFDVRVGRTVTTQFMLSEARLVGYANPWIRPPQEIYGLVPITNKDGIDAAYRLRFGEVTNTLRASYGTTNAKIPHGSVKARDIVDMSATTEYGPASFRVSYATGRVDLHAASLDAVDAALKGFSAALPPIPAFAPTRAQAAALAEKYRFDDAPISLIAVGASYDRDHWLLMAEWAKFDGHSMLADSRHT
jgi:hypothetical protein